jgi:class 3 adenylate cyclase
MNDYTPGPGDLPPDFGPYRILGKLGKGAMGTVYRAVEVALDRPVAVKVSRYGAGEPHLLERFRQEAKAAARFTHPNLCPVYAVGEIAGVHYLTMPFLEGRPLLDLLDTYPERPRQAVFLVETLARALAEAHAAGVIHRDVKPENVVFNGRGQPVLVDFGLAVRLDGGDDRLTRVGTVMGTPSYMSPEQHAGRLEAIGPASDVFSLGVLLYELLSGARPFEGTMGELERQKTAGSFPPLTAHRPGTDPRLEAVCRRALAPAPASRFESMTALADALAAYLDAVTPPPTLAAPARPAAADPPPGVSMHPSDPRIAEEVVRLMRQWGWEEGVARLHEKIRTTEDTHERGILRLLGGWMASERGGHAEGVAEFAAATGSPGLEAWALLGQAFVAFRAGDFRACEALLDEADRKRDPTDPTLRATLSHSRGALRYKEGRLDEAAEHLYEALAGFGPDSFGFGRVLDTLGTVYATRDDFATARLFFQRSLEEKGRFKDLPGQALSFGQLGRLYLHWDELDRAEEYFRRDLELCHRINDGRGEAQMYNHLAQVLLARGRPQKAMQFLDESVTRGEAAGWVPVEAFARKDRARARLGLGDVAGAEADARRAEQLFAGKQFAEGVFHARTVLALVRAAQGQALEAEPLLLRSAAHFDECGEGAEAARCYLYLARVRRQRGAAPLVVVEALHAALDRAERSRRDGLVAAVEAELREVDEAELCRRAYRRARGRGIAEDTTSLRHGSGEKATVLFLDLRNFSGWSLTEDPRTVMMTLNQIFADLAAALERHDIVVNQYLGDGFMALVREGGHARRAVAGALDLLAALERFNRPRRVLGLPPLEARVGVSTGDVFFGNVGTHRKVDFTAFGPTTNLAARLLGEAQPGSVCVSEETYKRVRDEVEVREPAGREAELKNVGRHRFWDVVGRRPG